MDFSPTPLRFTFIAIQQPEQLARATSVSNHHMLVLASIQFHKGAG
jgi:hypothetical protein